ncbi:hypothetical protein BC830DRAFT_1113014 [Chytriomyces sp. MP71]|nr:hypothetical protein BC830DRAFT_1113014 [Chytriomyces sp. MP71]
MAVENVKVRKVSDITQMKNRPPRDDAPSELGCKKKECVRIKSNKTIERRLTKTTDEDRTAINPIAQRVTAAIMRTRQKAGGRFMYGRKRKPRQTRQTRPTVNTKRSNQNVPHHSACLRKKWMAVASLIRRKVTVMKKHSVTVEAKSGSVSNELGGQSIVRFMMEG